MPGQIPVIQVFFFVFFKQTAQNSQVYTNIHKHFNMPYSKTAGFLSLKIMQWHCSDTQRLLVEKEKRYMQFPISY